MAEHAERRLILIIEDDRNIASLVERYLERDGFATLCAHDGETGLMYAHQQRPLLVVLDVMLPGIDGWEICRRLRRESDVPIVMLTAREDEADRVAGLSLGADDYVVKPFSPRELVERVKAILRRSAPRSADTATIMEHGGIRLDTEQHLASVDGAPVSLTPSEFALLRTLMARPGRVFSREELLNRLKGGDADVVDRVIDVHVGNLRQKIEADPSSPRYLQTVHGVGYRLADSVGD